MSQLDTRYSWLRLFISLLIAVIGNVGMWAIVVVMPDFQAEMGLDRANASLPYTFTMIGFAVGNYAIGRMVDRYGIVACLLGAAILNSAAFYAATLTSSLWIICFIQLLLGFASAATFGPLIADVSKWFLKRRGIAVADSIATEPVASRARAARRASAAPRRAASISRRVRNADARGSMTREAESDARSRLTRAPSRRPRPSPRRFSLSTRPCWPRYVAAHPRAPRVRLRPRVSDRGDARHAADGGFFPSNRQSFPPDSGLERAGFRCQRDAPDNSDGRHSASGPFPSRDSRLFFWLCSSEIFPRRDRRLTSAPSHSIHHSRPSRAAPLA